MVWLYRIRPEGRAVAEAEVDIKKANTTRAIDVEKLLQ
jgi:hypothetical protein